MRNADQIAIIKCVIPSCNTRTRLIDKAGESVRRACQSQANEPREISMVEEINAA